MPIICPGHQLKLEVHNKKINKPIQLGRYSPEESKGTEGGLQ